MTAEVEEVKVHELGVSWVKAPPAEVKAGTDMELKVGVSCLSACDLTGTTVKVTGQDAVVADDIELTGFDGAANETGEILVEAPLVPGEYTWIAVFPPQEIGGILHQGSSASCSFIVKPHATGIAVWDIPSPAVLGTGFTVKVGVNCLDSCNLTGREVEVYDHKGEKVASAPLRDAPYSDKVDLHWAEVELAAPETEGKYKWQARFPEPGLEIPHDEASHTFGFITAKPADYELTVEVINQDTDTPIKNAWVVLRPNLYRSGTDERGVAKIRVAKGEYRLTVSARERAPVGIEYDFKHQDFRGNPRRTRCTTDGREFIVYVPEANKDRMLPFKETVKVEGDTTIRVGLVGVIEPPEKDTL